jgi:two-component system cell cycle sensor histidine kinase/response regulator CckA
VIVSSGYHQDPIMANFRDYGFRDCIAKPYDVSVLSRTLARVLA